MPDRKTKRDGTVIVRARPYDRRPDAQPKRPVIGTYPNTSKGWKQAERAEAAWYATNRPDAQIRVGALRDTYLADHARRWDVLSTQRAAERTRGFCEQHAAEPAESIKADTCRSWLAEHPADRANLRAMWAWANAADLLLTNPWDRLGATGSAKARQQDIIIPGRGALTEEQLASLAAYAGELHGPWHEAMVTFTGYSGLRQGEVFAARPDWVDGDLLLVLQQYRSRAPQGQRWTLPKYGKTRTLALLPPAATALDGLNLRGEFLMVNPRDGAHWRASSYAYYWRTLSDPWSLGSEAPVWLRDRARMVRANRTSGRAQSGALTFHELRHTFATVLLERGVIHDQVALQLGDTVEQVYETYGHPRSIAAARDVQRQWARTEAERGQVIDLATRRAS